MKTLDGRLPDWWKTIDPEAHADYAPLKPAALELLKLPLAERRELVTAYCRKYGMPKMDGPKASGMYVFLRVIFQVPAQVPRAEAKVFGGWMRGSAGDDGQPHFDLSWPVTISGDPPRLHVARFDGYMGKGYDCLGEYEFFLGRFPFRSLETIARLVIE